MKIILSILLLCTISCQAQTKEDTEKWINYYLDKYFTSNYAEKNPPVANSTIFYTGGNYYFEGNKLVHFISTTQRIYSKSKWDHTDSAGWRRTEQIIDLSKVKKITYRSIKDSILGFSSMLIFDFTSSDVSTPSVKTINLNTHKDETFGYLANTSLYCYDEDILTDNILPRLVEALEHIVALNGGKIIKEVF